MTHREKQNLLNEFLVTEGLAADSGFLGFNAGKIIVLFGGAAVAVNVAEQSRAKKIAKTWFANHAELTSPFKSSKKLSKGATIKFLTENNIKTKSDPSKAMNAGGRICTDKSGKTIAYSLWFQYKKEDKTEKIELVNFIDSGMVKFKREYCATLAVMCGNYSDSMDNVFKEMDKFNKKCKKNEEANSEYGDTDKESTKFIKKKKKEEPSNDDEEGDS
jgi:hypothetical protein